MPAPNWQATQNEVRAWFEQGQSLADFDAVCDALTVITADPYGAGVRLSTERGLVFTYDVRSTDLRLVFLLAEQFHTVKVISILRVS